MSTDSGGWRILSESPGIQQCRTLVPPHQPQPPPSTSWESRRAALSPCRRGRTPSLDHLKTGRHAEDQGWEIIGVVHSHTHSAAYPSPTDVSQSPDPAWRYVIVGLKRAAPAIRSYWIRDGVVTEHPIEVWDG